MHKRTWNPMNDGPLSEQAIRDRYLPPSHFRISRKNFPPSTRVPGVMRRGICFALGGRCRYTFTDSVDLGPGEYAELPGGDYIFEVTSQEAADLVMVWPLPEEFWGASFT